MDGAPPMKTAAISLDVEFPDFPDAECIGADPADFFPAAGGGYNATVSRAKQVCVPCSERPRCLEWAFERGEHGVWGGTTELERQAVKNGKPPLTCSACGEQWTDPGRPGPKPKRCPSCRRAGR